MAEQHHFKLKFIKTADRATNPADPAYPKGMTIDQTAGRRPACRVQLPYPAECPGVFVLTCEACDFRAVITTAGRADDPRSVLFPCHRRPESEPLPVSVSPRGQGGANADR